MCKFKDTFDLIEKTLQSNKWAYQNLWFKFFSVIPDEVEKIIKKIPQLKDYYYYLDFRGGRNYAISNFDSQWEDGNLNENLQKADAEFIKQVVKGIPRPFNTPFNVVVFDEVNWFGAKAKPIQAEDKGSMCGTNADINSSHIVIRKEFDYGNKYNPITVKIEVTGGADAEILDDSGIAAVFTGLFGQCERSYVCYAIEEHEKLDFMSKEIRATKITEDIENRFWDREKFMPIDSGILPHHLTWDAYSDLKHMNDYGNMPAMSPKSAIMKVFKSTGYRYTGCQNCLYSIEKLDEFNNQILLGIVMAPNCRRMEADMDYKGLGFGYRMNLCQYTPDDQDGVVNFIENVYAATRYLEQNYFPKIREIYGRTPAWFKYSKQ